jgi:DNA-binding transcriptional MerR regulator
MSTISGYLTLKRAAQQLGVHEQTLRSWERQGLIRMARLPKSGYRRVPVEEVKRLQSLMTVSNQGSGVRLKLPRLDDEAQAEARLLAAAVQAELAEIESIGTFDEFMKTRRGRSWWP